MKNIVKIDGVEYIKKSKFDDLKKKQVKIIKNTFSLKDASITNPENTLVITPTESYDRIEPNKIPLKERVRFDGDLEFLNPKKTGGFPRVRINKSIYSYEYILQAENIAESLGICKDYEILVSTKDDEPLMLNFGSFYAIIAPRVEFGDEE